MCSCSVVALAVTKYLLCVESLEPQEKSSDHKQKFQLVNYKLSFREVSLFFVILLIFVVCFYADRAIRRFLTLKAPSSSRTKPQGWNRIQFIWPTEDF